MDPELAEQIKERFAQLPPDVQHAMQSNDTEEMLRQVGEAHHLHIDQMGALGDEVRLVMLGFADASEFTAALEAQAHIPADEAQKIAEELGEKIFAPIRESMKKFMEDRELDDAAGVIAESAGDAPASGSPLASGPSEPGNLLPTKPVQQSPALLAPPIMPAAQTILTQPTVTTNPTPRPYKTDPYLEPPE